MRRAAVDAPSEATRWQAAVHALSRSARLVATVAQVSQSGDAAHAFFVLSVYKFMRRFGEASMMKNTESLYGRIRQHQTSIEGSALGCLAFSARAIYAFS